MYIQLLEEDSGLATVVCGGSNIGRRTDSSRHEVLITTCERGARSWRIGSTIQGTVRAPPRKKKSSPETQRKNPNERTHNANNNHHVDDASTQNGNVVAIHGLWWHCGFVCRQLYASHVRRRRRRRQTPTPCASVLIFVSSHTCSPFLCFNSETVKTRMQVSGGSLGGTISGIAKGEGIAAFWKGIVFAYGRELS